MRFLKVLINALLLIICTSCAVPTIEDIQRFPYPMENISSFQRQGSLVKIFGICGGKEKFRSSGSGIIMDQGGIIATAAHVVSHCTQIFVESRETMYLARLLSETVNTKLDRAFIKLIGQVEMTTQAFRYLHRWELQENVNVTYKTFHVTGSSTARNLAWDVQAGDALEFHVAIIPVKEYFAKAELQDHPKPKTGDTIFIEGYPSGEHALIRGVLRDQNHLKIILEHVPWWERLFLQDVKQAIDFLKPLIESEEVILVETSFPCPMFPGMSGGPMYKKKNQLLASNVGCWPEGEKGLLIGVKF